MSKCDPPCSDCKCDVVSVSSLEELTDLLPNIPATALAVPAYTQEELDMDNMLSILFLAAGRGYFLDDELTEINEYIEAYTKYSSLTEYLEDLYNNVD